jgi:hypothetical protein
VNLIPNGSKTPVPWSRNPEYRDKLRQYHLSEFNVHVAAMYRGIMEIIPHGTLRLLNWNELELLVCGVQRVDVEYLKSRTCYSPESLGEANHIKFLWRVVESMSLFQRRQFLRFVSGRPTVPRFDDPNIKITSTRLDRPDEYLPESRTCMSEWHWNWSCSWNWSRSWNWSCSWNSNWNWQWSWGCTSHRRLTAKGF